MPRAAKDPLGAIELSLAPVYPCRSRRDPITDDGAKTLDTPQNDQPATPPTRHRTLFGHFQRFFLRGLAVLLPTIITIWIVIWAYQFVEDSIADPINSGVRWLVVHTTPYPAVDDELMKEVELSAAQQEQWLAVVERRRADLGGNYPKTMEISDRLNWMRRQPEIALTAREMKLEEWWNSVRVGTWSLMDLIGLVIAIVLIYSVGTVMGSLIGHRLVRRGERLIDRLPLVRRLYPSIKQVTDFIFGGVDGKSKINFSRVVAVQYPRKGLWSVGLVTGDTMKLIQEAAGEPCLTVFVASSPTPFTGYVITVPRKDTIDLPISVEDALKFAISGGVLIPPNQQIAPTADAEPKPTDSPASSLPAPDSAG